MQPQIDAAYCPLQSAVPRQRLEFWTGSGPISLLLPLRLDDAMLVLVAPQLSPSASEVVSARP